MIEVINMKILLKTFAGICTYSFNKELRLKSFVNKATQHWLKGSIKNVTACTGVTRRPYRCKHVSQWYHGVFNVTRHILLKSPGTIKTLKREQTLVFQSDKIFKENRLCINETIITQLITFQIKTTYFKLVHRLLSETNISI